MTLERIDARDVLDANGKTARCFRARIVGYFRRDGPNSWDDYVFVPTDGGETIDVLADVPIQVEPEGAAFRMRRHGEVERLVWQPADDAGDMSDVGDAPQRSRFLAECVRPFAEDAGIGGAAVIASKLRATSPKPSLD